MTMRTNKLFISSMVILLFAVTAKAYDARSYVQNGLVAQWDGIENVGFGVHNDAAKCWVDLTGNGHNLTNFLSGLTWSGDSLVMPSGKYGMAATLVGSAGIDAGSFLSYEFVYEQTETKTQYFVFGFSNFKGLAPKDATTVTLNNGANGGWQSPEGAPLTRDVIHHVYAAYKPESVSVSDAFAFDGVDWVRSAYTDSWTQKTSAIG